MYTNDRNAYRQAFYTVWQKHLKQLPLDPLEAQVCHIILQHPEYHRFLDAPSSFEKQEFALEENPFFHMSLHLAIAEQLQTNRPHGIREIHQALIEKFSDQHSVEHHMMACLSRMMWEAQQTGTMPVDEIYFQAMKSILDNDRSM